MISYLVALAATPWLAVAAMIYLFTSHLGNTTPLILMSLQILLKALIVSIYAP